MYIDEKLIKLLEPHNESKIDVSYAIRLINIVAKEYEVEQLTLTDVVANQRELLLKKQSDWLMLHTKLEVENIVSFIEEFKQ